MNYQLWLRQILAVVRMELGKNLLSMRALPLYLIAAAPVFIVMLMLFVQIISSGEISELKTMTGTAQLYAVMFQFILRGMIYLGCVWIFMNLFRGEVLDRSLHYYFLAPIRREVLVAGKFVSGWLSAFLLFGGSVLVSLLMIYAISGPARAVSHLLSGPGFIQLSGYLGITALACVGYGAVFLVVGLFFKNPIVPALMFWAWELLNPFLPVLLKKVSVIFYLNSLLPVPIDLGPFAVVADPAPFWIAVPGLLIFAGLTMVAGGMRIRKMEISYAD